MSDELLRLADEIDRSGGADNYLDVRAELALFEPDSRYTAARANAAGTKIIYRLPSGEERTHWALDWTRAGRRASTATRLRARASRLRMEVE